VVLRRRNAGRSTAFRTELWSQRMCRWMRMCRPRSRRDAYNGRHTDLNAWFDKGKKCPITLILFMSSSVDPPSWRCIPKTVPNITN
jgi:hypothetical protein